jgi:hypothetical protein
MTEPAILKKLAAKLANPPDDEADVLYLMVEIRKYLDHIDPDHHEFVVLRTYCDWSVHLLLRGTGAKDFLRAVDEAFASKTVSNSEREAAMKAAFERFSLEQFRQDLRNFLKLADLPLTFVNDPACWGQFLKHYIGVVSDCPFVSRQAADQSISKATLTVTGEKEPLDNEVEGTVQVLWTWTLEFVDGTTKTISHIYGYEPDPAILKG